MTCFDGAITTPIEGSTSLCSNDTSASPGFSWTGAVAPGGNQVACASGKLTTLIFVVSKRAPPITLTTEESGTSVIAYHAAISWWPL